MIQPSPTGTAPDRLPLARVGRIDADKVLNAERLAVLEGLSSVDAVLVVLAAGRGTRFGRSPKVIQPVCGVPLARRTIDAFQALGPAATICVVGYRHEEVMAALGPGPIYVRSDDSAGGTALAVYECFSVPQLASADPLLIVTMGDRVISAAVFRRVCETHRLGAREATLTMLTARYEPPKQVGKGRVVRDGEGRVVRIVEQRDIDAMADTAASRDLQSLSEGNCPLYAVRARALKHHLAGVSNDNAQSQFYLPDIVASMAGAGGDLRTVTVTPDDPEYDLVTSDVTRPRDLALLEGILRRPDAGPAASQVEAAGADLASDVAATVAAIAQDRPAGQAASIAAQLAELLESAARRGLDPDRPVGIGIAGGRVRIAFMHPDMARFYGPAWQMPCGAADADGREQIVVLVQSRARVWTPVIVWHDRGIEHGPVLNGTRIEIKQKGRGSWEQMRIWKCEYSGNRPPSAPLALVADAKAGSRVTLHWRTRRTVCAFEVLRSTSPTEAGKRIAAGLRGTRFDDFTVEGERTYYYQVRAVDVFGRRSGFARAEARTPATGPSYIHLPAQQARDVQPPLMLATDPQLGDPFLWAPTGAASSMQQAPAAGQAVFELRVPRAGSYSIWGRVVARSKGQDSFHVALDGGQFRIWHTGVHSAWEWSRIRTVELKAGPHKLMLKHREPGTRLSAVLVTDDGTFTPGER